MGEREGERGGDVGMEGVCGREERGVDDTYLGSWFFSK